MTRRLFLLVAGERQCHLSWPDRAQMVVGSSILRSCTYRNEQVLPFEQQAPLHPLRFNRLVQVVWMPRWLP